MLLETSSQFKEFELIDTGNGQRLERWGQFTLIRPDPQIIWEPALPESKWKADAVYQQRGENGSWDIKTKMPPSWVIEHNGVKLIAKLSPFKHTGIFAEQAANWEWMAKLLKNGERSLKEKRPLKFLNLFGYTGAATMVLTKLGHAVTHVDASKPALAWAKQNQVTNDFAADSIRWILDDAAKFVKRELKRGQLYDGILMDPPAFGHSPNGATWKFNRDLPSLLQDCVALLSPTAKFLLINGYATNSSALSLNNILEDALATTQAKSNGKNSAENNGRIEFGELCLKQTGQQITKQKTSQHQRMISTGIFARWQRSPLT